MKGCDVKKGEFTEWKWYITIFKGECSFLRKEEKKRYIWMAFLFSFEANICLPQTYGNSEWAAEPNDLNDSIGIRQWLLSLARRYLLYSPFEERQWLLLIQTCTLYGILKWFSCPHPVITGVCKVKPWRFSFFSSLYKNNFFFSG